MSENYIVINGKRIDLTEEQLKTLGVEVSTEGPFARVESEFYYFVNSMGEVADSKGSHTDWNDGRFAVANYCTNNALMEQRALHETLNRLLWRYSMQHDGEKIDWDNNCDDKYVVEVVHGNGGLCFCAGGYCKAHGICDVAFYAEETAEAAIEEVVKPFMEQHPEFKW